MTSERSPSLYGCYVKLFWASLRYRWLHVVFSIADFQRYNACVRIETCAEFLRWFSKTIINEQINSDWEKVETNRWLCKPTFLSTIALIVFRFARRWRRVMATKFVKFCRFVCQNVGKFCLVFGSIGTDYGKWKYFCSIFEIYKIIKLNFQILANGDQVWQMFCKVY